MKTAVEWLISEIQRYNDSGYEFHPKYNEEILEQAKEMEKVQIINAYNDAEDKCEYFIEEHAWQRYHHLSENYYKQTFKSE